MSSGFVRTEVISSADGINHEVSEKIENEEAERLRRRHEQDGQKSLYDQLAEQKEKMQEAYDEQTKLIFAPPRGLDEEELAHLQDVEERRLNSTARRDAEYETEVSLFALQQQRHVAAPAEPPPPALAAAPPRRADAPPPPAPTIKRKKKQAAGGAEKGGKRAKSASDADAAEPGAAPRPAGGGSAAAAAPAPAASALSLLAYGSDSADDD